MALSKKVHFADAVEFAELLIGADEDEARQAHQLTQEESTLLCAQQCNSQRNRRVPVEEASITARNRAQKLRASVERYLMKSEDELESCGSVPQSEGSFSQSEGTYASETDAQAASEKPRSVMQKMRRLMSQIRTSGHSSDMDITEKVLRCFSRTSRQSLASSSKPTCSSGSDQSWTDSLQSVGPSCDTDPVAPEAEPASRSRRPWRISSPSCRVCPM
eukprot:TRINITY_DN14905_c0_g3_i1.p1 TRINITY_DN14905_c0_g3~~TRINITY_DN14905_c0_g3_i1.p1  ORF type:complete len:238 (-),score=29.47 TRINITY_DN14905_c0_g3_i1:74-727(-)